MVADRVNFCKAKCMETCNKEERKEMCMAMVDRACILVEVDMVYTVDTVFRNKMIYSIFCMAQNDMASDHKAFCTLFCSIWACKEMVDILSFCILVDDKVLVENMA